MAGIRAPMTQGECAGAVARHTAVSPACVLPAPPAAILPASIRHDGAVNGMTRQQPAHNMLHGVAVTGILP